MIGARDPMGLVGQTLDGQFRVDEFVGEGGFSTVYRGYHTGLGEIVAIKCLKLQATLGSAIVESFVRRFRDEGRILYRLSQGNLHIVRSIASGTTIAGTTGSLVPYTVLEWLEGHSLAQDFERRRAAAMRGRSLAEAASLFSTAFEAVAYAHEAGVVHRDLNPGNIFLTQTREGVKAKVLDFGVAKIVSDHALEMGPRAQTIGQIKIFSPAYAAPEQFDEKLGKIGSYTDVYTLAIVFLEALRDEPAITGDNIAALITETLDRSRRPTPRTLGVDVPDAVERVFQRALAIDPGDRQANAGQLWSELAASLNIKNIVLPQPSLRTPPPGEAAALVNKPKLGTQTLRMDSPLLQQAAAQAAAKSAPGAMASGPSVKIAVGGASGLASTVSASEMEGRFSATMLAPVENPAAPPTTAILAGAPQPFQQQQQAQGYGPPPQQMHPMQQGQPMQQLPILATPQAPTSAPSGFNDETGIVRVGPRRTGLVVGIVVGVLVVIAVLAVVVWKVKAKDAQAGRGIASASASASASAIGTGTATPKATEDPFAAVTATTTATAAPTSTPTSTSTSTSTSTPTSTSTSTATATPTSTSTSTSTATPTSTSTSSSTSTPTSTSRPPTPIDPNAFNPTAADRALGTFDGILVSCTDARGQKGMAHVTFGNDGRVQKVAVDPPLGGTAGGDCVAARYKLAHTLKFEGPPQTVDHRFSVAK